MQADVQVSEVLGQEPPTEVLSEAGVIPENSAHNRPAASEYRERTVSLLEDIRDAVQEGN